MTPPDYIGIDSDLFKWVQQQAAILQVTQREVIDRCVRQVMADGLRDRRMSARLRSWRGSGRGRRRVKP